MLAFAWDHCFWSEQRAEPRAMARVELHKQLHVPSHDPGPATTVHGTYGTILSTLHHSGRTPQTLWIIVAKDPTYQTTTGACRRSEDVTAVLRWDHPCLPLLCAKVAQPTAVGANCDPGLSFSASFRSVNPAGHVRSSAA